MVIHLHRSKRGASSFLLFYFFTCTSCHAKAKGSRKDHRFHPFQLVLYSLVLLSFLSSFLPLHTGFVILFFDNRPGRGKQASLFLYRWDYLPSRWVYDRYDNDSALNDVDLRLFLLLLLSFFLSRYRLDIGWSGRIGIDLVYWTSDQSRLLST